MRSVENGEIITPKIIQASITGIIAAAIMIGFL